MGNKHEKLLEQINQLNLIAKSPRFSRISGLSLNFALLSYKTKTIINKMIWNPKDYFVQVSALASDTMIISVLGSTSIENFQKINNIINHLISFSITLSLDEDQICAICLENPSDTILECGHQFCSKDLESWSDRNNVCPFCELLIKPEKSFTRVDNYANEIQDEVKICKELIFSLIEY